MRVENVLKVIQILNQWWNSLFPVTQTCVFCSTPIHAHSFSKIREKICFSCHQRLTWICSPICKVCGRPRKQKEIAVCMDCLSVHPHDWIYNRSIFTYSEFVKQIIWRYKYRGQVNLAKPLSRLMAEVIEQHWGNLHFVLSYVPLHQRRLYERGFNQSELLANELSKRLRFPVTQLLERRRLTDQQSIKRRKERLKSLQNVFRVKEDLDLEHLVKYPILLIDDIYTTGATLRECARPLKQLGMKTVFSITIAR